MVFEKKVYKMNNVSFTYPPSPLLTQPENVPGDIICDTENIVEICANQTVCECVQIVSVPLKTSVEVILIDHSKLRIYKFNPNSFIEIILWLRLFLSKFLKKI